MVILAQGWLIWKLTGTELLLGALGLCMAVPSMSLTLLGGAIADKSELRRLLMLLESVAAFILLVLAVLSVTGLVQVWHIFAAAFVFGVIQAFDQPGRQALFPHLVDRSEMMRAVSLSSTIWPATRIVGPALAGFIIDRVGSAAQSPGVGVGAAFFIAALGFILFGWFLSLLRVPAFERSGGRNILREVAEGVRFVWEHKVFKFLTLLNFMTVFFVVTHVTLMPVFVSEILHGEASLLGSLHAAGGIGSLLGALIAAHLGSFRGRGALIMGTAAVQALCVVLFALSSTISISMVLQFLAGFCHALFMVCSQSTVQMQVPDKFRGRMMAIWGMNYGVVFPLGQMQMGTVANLTRTYLSGILGRVAGAPSAVILGASIMIGFVFLTFRNLRGLNVPNSERQGD